MTDARAFGLFTALLVGVGGGGACEGTDEEGECLSVQDLSPPDNLWCGGMHSPPREEWDDLSPTVLSVALPPAEDGSCRLCPRGEIEAEVEDAVIERVDQYQPGCVVERIDVGCAWSVHASKELGHEDDYCRYAVAYACEQ